MKKLFALILALLLALSCTSAFARTVYTKVTVDREQMGKLLAGFGIPEAQVSMADPILSLVNALGVRVTTVQNGAQVDLDLNGKDALSLGLAMDGEGVGIVSTLFPNYYLTLSNDTISQMMAQMSQNMPGAGGEGGTGGFDMAAMQSVFGGYYQKWMEACTAAGIPGDPVEVKYEYGNYVFDTMVPVTVDMEAITVATTELLSELLADPAAMAMLQGMAQGMSQSSGVPFDPQTFEADFVAGFAEWMAHFPDEVNAEVYTNAGDESGVFYMVSESYYEGVEDPFFTAYMLYEGAKNMDMGFAMDIADEETQETVTMTAGFAMKDTDMKMFFELGDIYYGLNMSFNGGNMTFDVFFMNDKAPLMTVAVEIAEGGDRTLPVDNAGKTVLAVEEIMQDANSEAAQGLYGDIQANGLGALMGVVMQQVPELGSLMGQMGQAS